MQKVLLFILLFILSCSESGVYDTELYNLNGRTLNLEKFRGKRLIVYVWSGTCIGHTEDLRRLTALYPKIKEKIELISVAVMMDKDDVQTVLAQNKIEPNYPVYADPKGNFAGKVTLIFLPATLLIDEKGKVIKNYPRLPDDLISFISSHQ